MRAAEGRTSTCKTSPSAAAVTVAAEVMKQRTIDDGEGEKKLTPAKALGSPNPETNAAAAGSGT